MVMKICKYHTFLITEILTEAEYLSVDPYMRAYMIRYKLPTDMIGGQVAK